MALKLRVDVSVTDTDDGMVLLDERSGRYWQLNRVGALILRSLLDGASRDEVATTLASRYPTARERIESDITTLVESLSTAKLVHA